MISVYNETKTTWGVKSVNESVVRLIKEKVVENKETNEKQVSSVSIIAFTQLFGDVETAESRLSKIKFSNFPTVLSYKPTSLVFNRKEFRPFVTERQEPQKQVLLASILLKGRRVISIRNRDSFLLDYFIKGGEFSFTASFNRPTAECVIEFYDESENRVDKYRFFIDSYKNKISLQKSESRLESKFDFKPVKIYPFRPARPTHLVLANSKDADIINILLNSSYNVKFFDETISIDQLIEEAKAENYKAVTLLSNPSSQEEEEHDKQAISKLVEEFKLVYKMNKSGEITKIKY